MMFKQKSDLFDRATPRMGGCKQHTWCRLSVWALAKVHTNQELARNSHNKYKIRCIRLALSISCCAADHQVNGYRTINERTGTFNLNTTQGISKRRRIYLIGRARFGQSFHVIYSSFPLQRVNCAELGLLSAGGVWTRFVNGCCVCLLPIHSGHQVR